MISVQTTWLIHKGARRGDRYALLSGDPGWSWNNIWQYLRKNEKWTPPADGHNMSRQYNPLDLSLTGINSVRSSATGLIP
ncbi:hypothetical protein DFH07DRAFT_357733 [Mycena maculata]|uniref:Uncharacterized protein n=1 Tax=Mycena maculata TaxID=230809 RepID=A0AAD7NLF4_9AGAR|nr:hypothetical protein DFH07DRAFT_357733 [Mycena maculata]